MVPRDALIYYVNVSRYWVCEYVSINKTKICVGGGMEHLNELANICEFIADFFYDLNFLFCFVIAMSLCGEAGCDFFLYRLDRIVKRFC